MRRPSDPRQARPRRRPGWLLDERNPRLHDRYASSRRVLSTSRAEGTAFVARSASRGERTRLASASVGYAKHQLDRSSTRELSGSTPRDRTCGMAAFQQSGVFRRFLRVPAVTMVFIIASPAFGQPNGTSPPVHGPTANPAPHEVRNSSAAGTASGVGSSAPATTSSPPVASGGPSPAPPAPAPPGAVPPAEAPNAAAPDANPASPNTAPLDTAPQSTAPQNAAPQNAAPPSVRAELPAVQVTAPLDEPAPPVARHGSDVNVLHAAPGASRPLGPKSLPYTGGPAPEGYVVQHRAWTPVWIAGAATWFAGWAYSAMIAGLAAPGTEHIAVPLAGPWIDLAAKGRKPSAERMMVALGSVQALGAGALIAGLVIDNPRYVRQDLASVHLSPVIGTDVAGAVFSGRF